MFIYIYIRRDFGDPLGGAPICLTGTWIARRAARSSRQVGIRVPSVFPVVNFSRGTLPPKKG